MTAAALSRIRSNAELRYCLTVLAIAAVCMAVAIGDSYLLTIAMSAAIWYLAISSLNLVVGYSGQFSAGHAALFGTGAYAAALAEIHLGVPPSASILVATAVSALISAAISVPLNRLRGPFLAMATFALQLAFTELLLKAQPVTGGANGLLSPVPISWNDRPISAIALLALVVLSCVLVSVLMFNMLRFRSGRALRAISTDETMAETLGIRIGRYRSAAFTLSGCIAGLAGYWQLQYIGYIDPTLFDLPASIAFLAVLIVGGRGSLAGPLFGVCFYYASHTTLSSVPTLEALLYGVLVVLAIRYARSGLAGLFQAAVGLVRARLDPSSVAVGVAEVSTERDLRALPAELVGATTADDRDDTPVPTLEVAGVAKAYGGVTVLTDVSFTVAPHSVVGLIGPNGAGKTTLLNIINGLADHDGGRISVLGSELPRTADPVHSADLGIGRTFQVPRLIESLTVTENIVLGHHRHIRSNLVQDLFGLRSSRREDDRARRLCQEIVEGLGLASYSDTPVAQLPHGLRRFIELARALAGRPRILLLDEPGAGLEPAEIDFLMATLQHVNTNLGLPIVVVDHNMRLVMGVSNEVVVLHAGKVISKGSPEEVRANPAVADAYLGTGALRRSGTGRHD